MTTSATILDVESYVFPRELLTGCDSALLLFCSGRMGAADGYWVREAGIADVTAIDWDEKTFEPFRAEFPDDWKFHLSDAWDFARGAERLRLKWDFVSVDVPSQYADQLRDDLPLWCSLARRFVTVTLMGDVDMPPIPDGWRIEDVIWRTNFRGRDFNWLVLERA